MFKVSRNKNRHVTVKVPHPVHKLNQAKLGLVKFRQSYWSNFHIVLRSDELTNLSLRNVS